MDVNDRIEALTTLPAKKTLGRASGNRKQSSLNNTVVYVLKCPQSFQG